MITVALAKGALLNDSVARFQSAGLDFSAVLDPGNRQLMVPSHCGRARALLVRNGDVPGWELLVTTCCGSIRCPLLSWLILASGAAVWLWQ